MHTDQIGTYSHQLSRTPGLSAILGHPVVYLHPRQRPDSAEIKALVGWGLRPSTMRPRALAQQCNRPFIALEDGFLRSYGTGPRYPTLSFVVDFSGIYYASDRTSTLEALLSSNVDVLSGLGAEHAAARERVVADGLSKYNLAPDIKKLPGPPRGARILIVDQTIGDASIGYGQADNSAFSRMLASARDENPGAIIYIKTHPEVSVGQKRGYLSGTLEDQNTILLRDPISPASLLQHMDRVYVVTSHMGFEALMHGVPVTCFGMPWYAGWGVTDDRQQCNRRERKRTVSELFSAAYMHYTRYLNPRTLQPGSIFDVIEWLNLQRKMQRATTGRTIAIGYRRWKAQNIRPFLGSDSTRVHFVPHAKAARALIPDTEDRLVVWGAAVSDSIQNLSKQCGATLLHMEDGFVRSVGLGSDFVPPHALVMDKQGLYFDARQPSDLETLLNNHPFNDEDRSRAGYVRSLIVDNDLTKYNIEPTKAPSWRSPGSPVILVPGQVEDDASILFGGGLIRDNLSLLKATREAHPDAFIVYKPHPDVTVRNRKGKIHRNDACKYADHVETSISIVNCINAADELHTITSLSGFDALLRGKQVVTYGNPFYAGWGLTIDQLNIARRHRRLTLEELIAGAMLHYPIYWDWILNGYTDCETALYRIINQRATLIATDNLKSIRKNYLERQWHKMKLWASAGFLVKR